MKYNIGSHDDENWIITEDTFDTRYLGKCEAIMVLGNGYMGIRSATEEAYVGEVRNTFVAGTFNQFDANEVTELPNAADVIQMKIILNGVSLDLTKGSISNYKRQLNVRTGELIRTVNWELPAGECYELTFRRFVSLSDRHLIGQRIEIIPINQQASIKLISGINGQMTNSSVQHFSEGDKRLYDNEFIQLVQTTMQSNIHFVTNTVHHFELDDMEVKPNQLIQMDRRKIELNYDIQVNKGQKLVIEKVSNIYTSRDKEHQSMELKEIKSLSYQALKDQRLRGYEALLLESSEAWKTKVWDLSAVTIESSNPFDQLAIRFAHYHLTIMTPSHDNRMNIAAKGLSGEGYKGHTFWDTEIFILPFWIYSQPKTARSLLEYRYHSLPGAHKKAKENGYEGAMFPWESAWLDDGEVTPVWGAADIVTGQPTKIWSGFIEQHITADISFAVWQYYQITHDEDFMERYGYELFMDTAKFWSSRLEWDEAAQRYHINDVVGPDEYTEHVNNNAFTNHMAYWTIKNAMCYYQQLKETNEELWDRLNQKLDLEVAYEKWSDRVEIIYRPMPREEDLVIPQDDSYLNNKEIDLKKYKTQKQVGLIFKDYNMEQVSEMQVSKQADVMILIYLLENLFTKETKIANWNYYEPRTLHDSSLSLAIHSVLASDLKMEDLAYDLFQRASRIDLGPNMKSSDHGIHAASIGGIWKCIVNGFGGVRMLDGKLRIEPHLPETWTKLSFPIYWHGERLIITITKEVMIIENQTGNKKIEFIYKGKAFVLETFLRLDLNNE